MEANHVFWLVFLASAGIATARVSRFPGYTFMFNPLSGEKVNIKDGTGTKIEDCITGITDFVDPERDQIDLNQFSSKYAECAVGYMFEQQPKQVAIYGEFLPQNAKYDGYKLFLKFGSVMYDAEDPEPSDVSVILVKWIHNEQAGFIYSLVEEEYTATTTTTVTSSKGVTASASATVGVEGGDPLGIVKVSASVTVSGSGSTDRENTASVSDTHTYALAENITVCPKCSAQVIWTLSESRRKVDWSAFVEISGWIMVKLANTFRGSDIWAFPIGDMGFYCPEFFERISPLQMNYLSRGIFEDTKSVQSTVTAVEFPIGKARCQNA